MSSLGSALLWGSVAGGLAACLRACTNRSRATNRAAFAFVAACQVGATAVLLLAILRQDFGLAYVAAHSRADSSTWYRIAALWSGAEGSLLLFAAMLAVVVWVACRRLAASATASSRSSQRSAVVSASASLALLGFTVAAVANPFSTRDVPAIRGAGLTPILEHPAMIYHPPLLYAGLVATAPPFLFVLARRDHPSAYRWATGAWTLLTAGLATGANWAYVELGWGGYWAWDPVENTVLIPWLVLTASLHARHLPSAPVLRQTLLAAPFVLVAFGAAVTRSGGLSSVHVFADADSIGIALGLWVLGLALMLGRHLWSEHRGLEPRSTERIDTPRAEPRSPLYAIWSSITAALLLAFVVLCGVVFPLVPGNDRILDSSYYASIGAPLLALALVALGFAAAPSKPIPDLTAVGRAAIGAVAGLVMASVWGATGWFGLAAAAALGAAVAGHLRRSQLVPHRIVMTLAHVGFVVLAIGIVASSQAATVRTLLEPGDSVEVAGHEVTYRGFLVTDGPRLRSEQSTADIIVRSSDRGDPIELQPGLVSYPDRAVVLAETALHSTPWRDVQVVLRAIGRDGTGTFDVAVRPGVMMVWWGAALMVVAGVGHLLQCRPRRVRVADPPRSASPQIRR